MYQPSICFAPAGIDACALWRMWMPHLNIPHSRFLFTEGIPNLDEMSECDIVVVQRLLTQENIKFMEIMRRHGLRIVYDLDDNVWNLPKSNPAKRFFDDPSVVNGLDACVEWADAITVSTRTLQRVVEDKWGWMTNVASKKRIPVIQIENCVDTKLFHKAFLPKDPDKIVIGWGGSNTHQGDVGLVWSLLPQLLIDFPNVFLEFVGQEPPKAIAKHERVRVRPWCHVSEYHNRLATWNWDIALAPLEMHRFNKSKSCIKMIEAGCIGSPCLAEYIEPYEHFCSYDKELQWLLCNDYTWKTKLYEIIRNRSLREDLGLRMHQNVIKNFDVERTAEQWQALSRSIF